MASQSRKQVPEAMPQASYSSIPELIGEWIRQGTEGFIATQKILLDLAAQQNALALTIVRERVGSFTITPSKTLFDLFGKGIHNFMEAQRVVLDIISKENDILSDGLAPGYQAVALKNVAAIVHEGVNNLVDAQKHFLTFFESQAEHAVKAYRDGKGFDTARLADLAREATHDFLNSQKKFLAIMDDHLTSRKEEPVDEKMEASRICLADMAKQSIDALVEAEKRLLDLASSQVDINVKAVRELYSPGEPAKPSTSLPDIMKKSVDSFVAAQKALVELASKPRRQEVEERELAGVEG